MYPIHRAMIHGPGFLVASLINEIKVGLATLIAVMISCMSVLKQGNHGYGTRPAI